MAGIFKKIKEFAIGQTPFEIWGGEKGGYHYFIVYDTQKKEIISQHITPPNKTARSIGVNAGILGQNVGVNYQSEKSLGAPFSVFNTKASSKIGINELANELGNLMPQDTSLDLEVRNLEPHSKVIAGMYGVDVAPTSPENPKFEAHFGILGDKVEAALGIFPQYVVSAYWGDMDGQNIGGKIAKFRASIFLHDAIDKCLKMRASYNMAGHKDLGLIIPDGDGTVGVAITNRDFALADFAVMNHDERGVPANAVWADMKSILAVPILDSDNVALGVLSVDSNLRTHQNKFEDDAIHQSMLVLARGIGRFLEASI